LDFRPQLQFYPHKCIGCGECRKVGGDIAAKAEACNAEALVLRGRTMTVSEVMAEIDRDRYYYESSNPIGGVTFSGGEPLMQIDFLKALLLECKSGGRNYHTAVDTAGNVPWNIIESVMRYVDLWLYDIKLADEKKHKSATGASNDKILSNLKNLALQSVEQNIIIRIPIVPGINDDTAELESIAGILSDAKNIQYVELLPLNHAAESKYASLSMEYKVKDYPAPSPDDLTVLSEAFAAKGVSVKSPLFL